MKLDIQHVRAGFTEHNAKRPVLGDERCGVPIQFGASQRDGPQRQRQRDLTPPQVVQHKATRHGDPRVVAFSLQPRGIQRVGHQPGRDGERSLGVAALVGLLRGREQHLGPTVVRLGEEVALAPVEQRDDPAEGPGAEGVAGAVGAGGEPSPRGRFPTPTDVPSPRCRGRPRARKYASGVVFCASASGWRAT